MKLKDKFNAFTKTKKIVVITVSCVLIAAIIATAVTCGVIYGNRLSAHDFKAYVAANDIWVNDLDSRVPQCDIYTLMFDHFYTNSTDKTPKLLFLGYDGCLASIINESKNNDDSAIYRLLDMGGTATLAYAGGATVGDQATSTAPGWASIFTGVWATEHGVAGNGDTLNENTRSIMYTLAEDGISASYSVSWDTHIKTTYSKEVASAAANAYPIVYNTCNNDSETVSKVLSSVNSGIDATFCTLEYTDHQGHTTGFNDSSLYKNAFLEVESVSNDILDAVFARDTYDAEDWLIIIASDHGGTGTGHGGKTVMESATFYVVY